MENKQYGIIYIIFPLRSGNGEGVGRIGKTFMKNGDHRILNTDNQLSLFYFSFLFFLPIIPYIPIRSLFAQLGGH